MSATITEKPVLMVDDEPNVLDGYRRSLRGQFPITTAPSGAEGLSALEEARAAGRPFAIVVSDMKMPVMDGAQFLGRARALEPDAVQLLLSGQADLESTIAAVNNGNVFRFLTKPCPGEELATALSAALRQYELVNVERQLLEQTLAGAVDVLTEVLSMAVPEASARTDRVRALVGEMAPALGIDDWRLSVAATLSQLGSAALPDEMLHRARTGGELTADELELYLAHPATSAQLLRRIPRLEDIAGWIGDQPVRDGEDQATSPGPEAPADAPVVLHAALGYLAALDVTGQPKKALSRLAGRYPPEVLGALDRATIALAPQGVLKELPVGQVTTGMLLDADVETTTGMVLVRKGERVTEAVAMRLANFARTVGVKEPVKVLDGV